MNDQSKNMLAGVGLLMMGALVGYFYAAGTIRAEMDRQQLAERIEWQVKLNAAEEKSGKLQQELAGLRQKTETPGVSVTTPPAGHPIAAAVGELFGIPAPLTNAAIPMLEQANANMQRSADAAAAARRAGQDGVVRVLLSPQGCGSGENSGCILQRMCTTQPDSGMRAVADACHDNRDCWRNVLLECGAFKGM